MVTKNNNLACATGIHRTAASRLLLMTLLLFAWTGGAKAQQALPYEYGFEDNNLANDGWVLQGATSPSTKINNSAARTGSNGFQFYYSEQSAYLISPILTGGDAGVEVSFWYKEYSNQYGDEQFQVGYTTDETNEDASTYTYDNIVMASTSWQEYTNSFPAGTKRIAIKYIYNDCFYLYLDDFNFAAVGDVARPVGLTINYTGGDEATVSWTSSESAFDLEVNGTVIEDVTNPYTLTGLSLATTYNVKVRAKKGSDVSDWTNPVSFSTDISDDMCQIKLELTDSYGDSWNGNAIKIVDVLSGIVIGTYTNQNLDGTSNAIEVNTLYAAVPNGRDIEFQWVKGSYPGECSWNIYDINGDLITEGQGTTSMNTGDVLATYTVDCKVVPWKAPSDLAVSEITATSAKLSWTENSNPVADSWVVAIKAESDADFDFESAKENPFVLENLTPDTNYKVKVRPDTDEVEKWSSEINFTTNELYSKPTALAVTEVSSTTVVLSWTENGIATNWEVAYKAEGNTDFDVISAKENPFTLEGLTPETNYTAKVRSVDGSEHSSWSDETTFTTSVKYPVPVGLAASNVTTSSATINWTGNANAESYNLRYAVSNAVTCDFESVEAWSVDNFSPFTAYDGDGSGTYTASGASFTNQGYTGSVITMDNDNEMGTNWTAHSGTKFGCFMDADTPPNNDFFITPEVTITEGSSFGFWARSITDKYGLERIKVGVYSGYGTFSSYLAGGDADYIEVPTDWTEYSYDLSSYKGQTIQLAINCVSDDAFALFIDDVYVNILPTTWSGSTTGLTATSYELDGLTPETNYIVQVQSVYSDGESKWAEIIFTTPEDVPTPSALAVSDVAAKTAVLSWTENGTATAWEICLNDDEMNLVAADSNPFTLTALTPETEYTAKVRAVNGEKRSNWCVAASFTTDIEFHAPSNLTADNITTTSADISWTADAVAATASSFELQYAEATSSWNYYDNGTYGNSIGAGGAFYWGVMFPAGSYEGNKLLNVSIYDYSTMTGTITIYNDGDNAPAGDAVSTKAITLTGTHEMAEFSFNNLAIDNTKNVWVIVYNETGTDYPAAYSSEATTNPNGRWVSLDGTTWKDINDYGYSYPWMIRAEIGTGVEPSWTTVPDASSPTELTGLTPFTDYIVRVKAIYGTEGESLWKKIRFQTLNDNPVPSNILADLTADGATLTWDGMGDSYNVQYRIASSHGSTILEEDFENGLGNWQAISNNTANAAVINSNAAMNGANGFRFSSYNSASDYNQYLISPELNSVGTLEFYYASTSYANETFTVGYSTTGTDIDDFTWGSQITASSTSWTKFHEAIPDGTKYFAINYCSNYQYYLYIDDISIYETIPAGAWQNLAVTDATATISGLATNNGYEYQVQSVKGSNTSDWSETGKFALLTLGNATTNNTDLIQNYGGLQAHVTLSNRKMWKDGDWNTICLPFDVTIAGSSLDGATLKELDGTNSEFAGTTLTINFKDATNIVAGKPYLIKWAETSPNYFENPVFSNVMIKDASTQVSFTGGKFVGIYDATSFTANDESILFFGANNTLYHPASTNPLGAFRAYFQLDSSNPVKSFVVNFDDEDEATGIITMEEEKGRGKLSDGWYTIDGRELGTMPTHPGVYLNNGKKVIIK